MFRYHFLEKNEIPAMGSDYDKEKSRLSFVETVSKLGSMSWKHLTPYNQERLLKKHLDVSIKANVFGTGESMFRFVSLSLYDYMMDAKKHPFDFDCYRTFITPSVNPTVTKDEIENVAYWYGAQAPISSAKVLFLLGDTATRFVLGSKLFNSRVAEGFEWGDLWFVKDKILVPLPSRLNIEKKPSLEDDMAEFGFWFQDILSELGFVHNFKPFSKG